ncbi:hypothetical protein RJT34_16126 [Clitoria ternatea]|uniref:Uncharacterized protein n=1 Tax=Clitoria ternatea TaxID=43366 RepID=A0AAN9J8M4_CLITE
MAICHAMEMFSLRVVAMSRYVDGYCGAQEKFMQALTKEKEALATQLCEAQEALKEFLNPSVPIYWVGVGVDETASELQT